uniref:Uncharacterized protein n=1 Tax=Nelumbo nucifera TaxID=4432 RepID=A0A822ZC99_NELNU|nr:TPA_asm: hypothetical protein HUJ06_013481 [Nelumbo nucifera]
MSKFGSSWGGWDPYSDKPCCSSWKSIEKVHNDSAAEAKFKVGRPRLMQRSAAHRALWVPKFHRNLQDCKLEEVSNLHIMTTTDSIWM